MMADHHHDERSPLLVGNNNNDGIEPNQNDQEIQQVIRSSSSRRDSPQYEGLPEVKKKLRWIVPAVAIGVKFFSFFFLSLFFLKKNWPQLSNFFDKLKINILETFFFPSKCMHKLTRSILIINLYLLTPLYYYIIDIPLSCRSDHCSKFLRHHWE